MITIAYLCEYATLLGGERSLLTYLHHAHRIGVQPLVLAPAAGPLPTLLDERRIPRLSLPPGGKRSIADLVDELQRRDVRLVHGNSLMTLDAVAELGQRLATPMVVHVRDVMRLSNARMDRLRRQTAVIAVSQEVRQQLLAQGADADLVHVIRNAITPAPAPMSPTELRRRLGWPPNAAVVVSIGQICLRKGQDLLLQAAARVAERLPDLRLLLIGQRYSQKAESIDFEARLRSLLEQPPLAGRSAWLTAEPAAANWLTGADLVVVSSRQEPLSRVLLESLAAGVPALATDVGGSREIIVPAETGLLVPADDPAALAGSMIKMLTDRSWQERCRSTGPAVARERFGIEQYLTALARIYADGGVEVTGTGRT